MNKRNIAIILLIVAGIIFIITIALFMMEKNKKEITGTDPHEKENQSDTIKVAPSGTIRIDNLDGLYFYTRSDHSALKEQISEYLNKNGYNGVKVLDIVGTPTNDDDTVFIYWLYASLYNIVIRCEYNLETNQTNFSIEQDQKILDNLPGIKLPLNDGDYSNIPDNLGKPEISNIEKLKNIMSENELSFFINELNDYLIKNNEYRRSFNITNIINSRNLISFDCVFAAHGLDDYDINAVYWRKGSNEGSCNFTIIDMVETQEKTNE